MNRILYVARKAKGLTEKQVAEVLKIEESEYMEYECNLKKLSSEIIDKLEELYNIHPSYLMMYDAFDSQEIVDGLEECKVSLTMPEVDGLSAIQCVRVSKMGMEALIFCEKLKVSRLKQLDLEKENSVLRKLYDELRQSQRRSRKSRRSIDILNK